MKFKVGDKITHVHWLGEWTITKIKNEKTVFYIRIEDSSHWFQSDNFRLIEKKKAPKEEPTYTNFLEKLKTI